jgi:uncharacterized protein with PIN domain
MSSIFLLDGMLGSLTRWLRICGYDAEFVRSLPDDVLIEHALSQGQVLLTRDALLSRKAQRAGLDSFIVEGRSDEEMLASVATKFHLDLTPNASKCPVCGGPLTSVGKDAVCGKVPGSTYEAYDEFWECGSCCKLFWRGSHWSNIRATIQEARRLAGLPPIFSEQDL